MRRSILLLAAIALLTVTAPVTAENGHDCDSPDSGRRIKACTELLDTPGLSSTRRATAFANRALAYSLQGEYETAVRDYDEAIRLQPNFAVALNNRAWAYFKWGRAPLGMPDVQRSLQLDPMSPHSLDTRAHIKQWMGDADGALRDYEAAMLFGGPRMVALYQCGLKIHRLYDGPNDGFITPKLRKAMQMCVAQGRSCDPLPPDEECREAIS